MSESEPSYVTTSIEPADAKAGFSCGNHALDDFFARHAVRNDEAGVGRAYVLRRDSNDDAALPIVLGFYTLSMASAESSQVAKVLEKKLPKYPIPGALIDPRTTTRREVAPRRPSARGRCIGDRRLHGHHRRREGRKRRALLRQVRLRRGPRRGRATAHVPADRYRTRCVRSLKFVMGHVPILARGQRLFPVSPILGPLVSDPVVAISSRTWTPGRTSPTTTRAGCAAPCTRASRSSARAKIPLSPPAPCNARSARVHSR